MEQIIEAKNLIKSYGYGVNKMMVLKNLDISVLKGQFLSITGKSGSGKSTFLYQLALLDVPDSGQIKIDGTFVSSLSIEQKTKFRLKKLGYVFQDYALLPELTAIENVALPLLMQGFSKKDATHEAHFALEKIGLGNKLNCLPNQLSGGQQQRVSIARAIAHNPKIIFADEPTANLDTETSRVVLNTFLELNKLGQTIVMVTHEKEYAAMADRTVELSDGVIISDIINRK